MHTKFVSQNLKGEDHLGDLDVMEGYYWSGLTETGCEGMDSIHLRQDRDKWRALVNTVMKLRVPQKAGLCSTELVKLFPALATQMSCL
jgi:hypothetical protein